MRLNAVQQMARDAENESDLSTTPGASSASNEGKSSPPSAVMAIKEEETALEQAEEALECEADLTEATLVETAPEPVPEEGRVAPLRAWSGDA